MSTHKRFFSARATALRPLLTFAFLFLTSQPCCTGAQAHAHEPALHAGDAAGAMQSSSIMAYNALRQQAPHLFAQMGNWQKGEISLVTEPSLILEAQELFYQKYVKKFTPEVAWAASRAGVIMQDPYVLVLRDAVRFPNGKLGLYNRKVTRSTLDGGVAGAFCLPLLQDGRVAMLKEYRHQERRWRLSVPGGFRDAGESSEDAARREATEETGYKLQELTLLGELDAEGEAVPLYIASVAGYAAATEADEGEALGGVIPMSFAELKKAVIASGFRDANGTWLSLQANLGSVILMAENFVAHRPERP